MSQFPPQSVLLSHGFVAIKWKLYNIQVRMETRSKSLCSWTTVASHCTDSGEVRHTERSRWLHDASHTVPTLTVSILPSSCAAHPHSNPNPTTHSRTVTFPSPCTTHCKQCMLLQGLQSSFHKFSCPPCYCYSLHNCHLWRWDDLQMYGIPVS